MLEFQVPADYTQDIPVDIILKMLGYPEVANVNEEIKGNIKDIVKLAEKKEEAKVIYQETKFEILDPSKIKITSGHEFRGEKLIKKVQDCDGIVMAVMTMGKKLDEKIKELMAKDPLNGFILDTISSYMVEKVSELFWQDLLFKYNEKDLNITSFISPGSKDFSLDNQKNLISFLRAEEIGIKLLDSMLIEPSKTLTVIMGYGKNIKGDNRSHNCAECDMEGCLLRGLH